MSGIPSSSLNLPLHGLLAYPQSRGLSSPGWSDRLATRPLVILLTPPLCHAAMVPGVTQCGRRGLRTWLECKKTVAASSEALKLAHSRMVSALLWLCPQKSHLLVSCRWCSVAEPACSCLTRAWVRVLESQFTYSHINAIWRCRWSLWEVVKGRLQR